MDLPDSEIRSGLSELARLAPEPAPLDSRRSVSGRASHRGVLTAALCLALAALGGLLLFGLPGQVEGEQVLVGADSGALQAPTAPTTLPTVPPAVGEIFPGTVVDGVPDWLTEFVVARGGVNGFPVVDDKSLMVSAVAVLCPSPPTNGSPQIALNDSAACTFVVRYEAADGSGESLIDLCLRRADSPSSACTSEEGDPAIPVPDSDLELVVFRRNLSFDPTLLRVSAVGSDWTSLPVSQTEFLTWRTGG